MLLEDAATMIDMRSIDGPGRRRGAIVEEGEEKLRPGRRFGAEDKGGGHPRAQQAQEAP
jgi:hypothetical protein